MEFGKCLGKRKYIEEASTEEEEEVVKSIIICCIRSPYESVSVPEDDNKEYDCYDFFKINNLTCEEDYNNYCVDLDRCFESLMSCYNISAMFQMGPTIYFTGTLYTHNFEHNNPVPEFVTIESTNEQVLCTKGMSWVNCSEYYWVSGVEPPLGGLLESATLAGKVYTLSTIYLQEPMMYDPVTAQWYVSHAKPPTHLEMCHISGKLLSDHAQGRIFVHFSNIDLSVASLYAWYPQGNPTSGGDIDTYTDTWVCIHPRMGPYTWKKKPTLADEGLIFFYFRKTEELFRVLDVQAKQWLKVEWPVLYPRLLDRRVKGRSLFYLGDRRLCLAISTTIGNVQISGAYGSQISLLVFEYNRSDSIITMRHLCTNNFYAKGIYKPVDFVPLAFPEDPLYPPLLKTSSALVRYSSTSPFSNPSITEGMCLGKRKHVEGVAKSIIICGIRSSYESICVLEESKGYDCFEFFRIGDLNFEEDNNKCVDLDRCFESLMTCYDISAIFQMGSTICLTGTHYLHNFEHPVPESVTIESTNEQVRCSKGISWVNWSEYYWVSGVEPPMGGLLHSATLAGKIYTLATVCLQKPMMYDPVTAQWSILSHAKPPTTHLQMCHITGKMLSDHAQGRIFVHLFNRDLGIASLYAWYPQGNPTSGGGGDTGTDTDTWVCIHPRMAPRTWKKKPTLADEGLIFFYFRKTEELFHVLDVQAKRWLKVEWPVLYPRLLNKRVKGRSLFYLGNRHLCLAISTTIGNIEISGAYGSQISLLVFEYNRSDTTITMRHLCTNTFYAKGIFKPVGFVPLDLGC